MFTATISTFGNMMFLNKIGTLINASAFVENMRDRMEKCAEEMKTTMVVGLETNKYNLAPNSNATLQVLENKRQRRQRLAQARATRAGRAYRGSVSGVSKTPMIMSGQMLRSIKVKEMPRSRRAPNEIAYFIGVPRTSKLHKLDARSAYGKLCIKLGHKPITIYGVADINTRRGGYWIRPFGNRRLRKVKVPQRDFVTPAFKEYEPIFKAKMLEGIEESVTQMMALSGLVRIGVKRLG